MDCDAEYWPTLFKKQIYNLITAVSNVPSVYYLRDEDLNYTDKCFSIL